VMPVRARAAEALLEGAPAAVDGTIEACAEAAAAEVEPVADANGSVEYKRALVGVLVGRCVAEALSTARP
ncbi:MAG: xanthine dehydrogenase family protein subunit M, partial [Solirubrobacteraceae bacterium]